MARVRWDALVMGAGLFARATFAQDLPLDLPPAKPAAAAATGAAAAVPGAPAAKKPAAPSAMADVAKALVDAVKVAADDVVLVRANVVEATALAELVVAEVARRGATPVYETMPPSVVRALVAEMPEGYLERANPYAVAQTQLANAVIDLGSPDDPALALGTDPLKFSRWAKGRQAVADKFYATEIRRVVLAGTSFPTADAAKLFKADPAALAKGFWEAVNVKQAFVDERVLRTKKVLAGLRVVKVTAAGGTELELRLAARPILANTGRIDDDAAQRQGVKEVSLPAGDVMTVPTEFFANGTLVVDAAEVDGVLAKNLKFTFREGKAVLESGGENFEAFKRSFNAAAGDKAVIASFGVGTNEASKPLPNSFYRSSEMSGIVTIGIGYNRRLGGFNTSAFAATFRLAGATVKIDDVALVEAGVLKLR